MWTKETALPVIQQAFDEGKLSAQNGATTCKYRSAFGPCVIGLLIDDETAKKWDNFDGYETSVPLDSLDSNGKQGVSKLFDDTDLVWFIDLQKAHDKWINVRRSGYHEADVLVEKERFTNMIGR